MKKGIMSAFDELQRRMNDRCNNSEKYAKEVCGAWCDLYLALGGKIEMNGYTATWGILPNATRCLGLIISARAMEERMSPFPNGKIYVNGKDGEYTSEYKAYLDQPHGVLNELWDAAADACEESVS